MKEIKTISIGIDLGTTYSSLSYPDQHGNIIALKLLDGQSTSMPSWISISKPGKLIVGQEAKDDINLQCVGFNSKRLIGLTIDEINEDDFTFQLEEKNNMVCMLLSDPTEGVEEDISFYPQEISGFIVKRLIDIFKYTNPGIHIGEVCVAVPNGFSDSQLKETERACSLAGIENVELMKEPSASIVTFKHLLNDNVHLKQKYQINETEMKHIVVVDFGGGTLDVSYCQMKGDKINVIKNRMNNYLGGNDFDKILIEIIQEKLEEYQIPLEPNYFKITRRDARQKVIEKRKRLVRLQKEAERIKIELSTNKFVHIDLEKLLLIENEQDYQEIIITRDEFITRSEEIINEVKICVEKLLKDSKIKANKIDIILPIGGSCCIPKVKDELRNIFFKSMIVDDSEFNPLLSVSMGCCIKANRHKTLLEEIDIYDVMSFGMGICHSGNEIDYFIRDGEKIPHEENKYFEPLYTTQETVKYKLYKGNSLFTDNVDVERVDTMTIILPKNIDRNKFIMCAKCSVNTNGIVSIRVTYSKDHQSIELGELIVKMDLDKSEEIIEEMKRHFNDYYFSF